MDRVKEFEQKRFGMFIHFGLFSQVDRGEWTFHEHPEVAANYKEQFENFNPKNLDWKQIVGTAKKAGMKYITLTTRHHDGFSLYDTKGLNEYDVMHTPYGKDIVKEFVDECNRQNIQPFLYHTMHDWQLPLFEENFDEYLKYLQKSIEILCTNYGTIGGFWFDGNWSNKTADWKEDELYGLIRKYQPNAIIINNSGLANRGKRGHKELDTLTFEQGNIFDSEERNYPRRLAMEACQTMNKHWGAASNDLEYKTPRTLIEMLNKCRKLEANYLLNIGLTGLGEIPTMSKGLLECMGTWTNYAGPCFYDGVKSEVISSNEKDYALDYEGKTYVFMHDIPQLSVKNVMEAYGDTNENNSLSNVSRKIKSITWKDNNESLLFTQNGSDVSFRAIGFPYGANLIVRVAVIEYED